MKRAIYSLPGLLLLLSLALQPTFLSAAPQTRSQKKIQNECKQLYGLINKEFIEQKQQIPIDLETEFRLLDQKTEEDLRQIFAKYLAIHKQLTGIDVISNEKETQNQQNQTPTITNPIPAQGEATQGQPGVFAQTFSVIGNIWGNIWGSNSNNQNNNRVANQDGQPGSQNNQPQTAAITTTTAPKSNSTQQTTTSTTPHQQENNQPNKRAIRNRRNNRNKGFNHSAFLQGIQEQSTPNKETNPETTPLVQPVTLTSEQSTATQTTPAPEQTPAAAVNTELPAETVAPQQPADQEAETPATPQQNNPGEHNSATTPQEQVINPEATCPVPLIIEPVLTAEQSPATQTTPAPEQTPAVPTNTELTAETVVAQQPADQEPEIPVTPQQNSPGEHNSATTPQEQVINPEATCPVPLIIEPVLTAQQSTATQTTPAPEQTPAVSTNTELTAETVAPQQPADQEPEIPVTPQQNNPGEHNSATTPQENDKEQREKEQQAEQRAREQREKEQRQEKEQREKQLKEQRERERQEKERQKKERDRKAQEKQRERELLEKQLKDQQAQLAQRAQEQREREKREREAAAPHSIDDVPLIGSYEKFLEKSIEKLQEEYRRITTRELPTPFYGSYCNTEERKHCKHILALKNWIISRKIEDPIKKAAEKNRVSDRIGELLRKMKVQSLAMSVVLEGTKSLIEQKSEYIKVKISEDTFIRYGALIDFCLWIIDTLNTKRLSQEQVHFAQEKLLLVMRQMAGFPCDSLYLLGNAINKLYGETHFTRQAVEKKLMQP